MLNLIKPQKLKIGDTVATVSLSNGSAGDKNILQRYYIGKQRLENQFGLRVVEMKNTLKGSKYLYHHPELRAMDLMDAFSDKNIKAIFTCIGGYESIRILPYIKVDVIKSNPKIFLGYSDSTITHLICLMAGLSSFYGVSVLAELAENIEIFDYTADYIKKVLFQSSPIGEIKAAKEWTGERIEWTIENAKIRKKLTNNDGYEFIQGNGVRKGRLIGGCMEVLEMAKGASIWPKQDSFENAILFFETSEDTPQPNFFEYWLRNYGSQGILQKSNGIIFGKPYQEKYYHEYKKAILKVLHELHLYDLPVIYNATFGHNEPMCILPYGAMAKIDCDNKTFMILESGVVDG